MNASLCLGCGETTVPYAGHLCASCRKDGTAGPIKPQGVPRKPRGTPPSVATMLRRQVRMLQTQQLDLMNLMYDADPVTRQRVSRGYDAKLAAALNALTPNIERMVDAARKYEESKASKASAMSPDEKAEVAMEYLSSHAVSVTAKKRAVEMISASLAPKLREVK